MAGNTISITFKLEGDAQTFKNLTKDADGLKKVMTGVVSEASQLKGNVINFAALATGINAAQRSFDQLQGAMQGLADAYAVQETAERKLETVMRQRMGATDAEIQSIKDLASAQQGIGIIGDEVQLSGAQQVATFLNEKASIDTLLPAMNNLLAQQKGLNATTGDAVSVANLMGKAMQGQTSALTRVGITFTDAQANVMKYGTEAERAAMLAQIITDNVGNMNQELAQTESGKQQQLANTLGDVKEQIGGLVNGALPFVTIAAQASRALGAIAMLVAGTKTLTVTMYASAKAFAVSTAAFIKNKAVTLATAAAQKVVSAATVAWTAAQKILNLVLTANPIGILITAIGALVAAVIYAYNNCEGFRNILSKVWEVIGPLANAIMNGLAKALEWLAEKCKQAWVWLKNILGLGGKKVEVAVEVSKPKSGAPALDLGAAEAKYANYKPGNSKTPTVKPAKAEQLTPKTKASEGLISKLEEDIADARKRLNEATSEAAIEAINKEIAGYEEKLGRYRSLGQKVGEAVEEGVANGTRDINKNAATLKDITDNIQILQDQLQTAGIEKAAAINQEIDAWNRKADAIKRAGIEAEKTGQKNWNAFTSGWGAAKKLEGSITGITNALKGNGNAWQIVCGIIDGFIGLYESVRSIIGIINLLTGATNTLTAAKQGEAAATAIATTTAVTGAAQEMAASASLAAVKSAETNANVSAAASGAMAAHSGIPFVGIALGLAAVAAIIAAMASLPKFANGGIVSGPTLALVGEYAGASGNPEVIAPLDKLRGMLTQPAAFDFSKVQFEIKGRTLVGILAKENNITKRS